MIGDICGCISKSGICVVSKRHHPNILDILREEVLEPEGICLAVGPSLLCISVKSMDGYKTTQRSKMSAGCILASMKRTYSAWILLGVASAVFGEYKTSRPIF